MARVLRELGFNVRSLLGRVVLSNPPALPPRTHRLLLVELEGEKWIQYDLYFVFRQVPEVE